MKKSVILILIFVLAFLTFLFFNTNDKSFSVDDNIEIEETQEIVESELKDEPKVANIKNSGEPKEEKPKIPTKKVETPDEVKSIYLTAYSAGSSNRINQVLDYHRNGEINSVIIDVNGYAGFISYDSNLPEMEEYNLEEIRTPNLRELVRRLNDEGIYVIARITVFQDTAYAKARPDLAVKTPSTGEIWIDNGKQGWLDPASREVWDYKLSLAKEVSEMGFDELNFDYIRFPSDGDLRDIEYPFWDGQKTRSETLKEFFAFLRENLEEEVLSVDFFGLTTVAYDDLGIGQVIEDAYAHFDFIAPMVYPSHYANGFMTYQNPAQEPYGVVHISMWNALKRLETYRQNNPEAREAKLRPWLQDFDLGANYDSFMVKAQIDATKASLGDDYVGFMMWSPSNNYTRGAL